VPGILESGSEERSHSIAIFDIAARLEKSQQTRGIGKIGEIDEEAKLADVEFQFLAREAYCGSQRSLLTYRKRP
jgi:hypothetical protein